MKVRSLPWLAALLSVCWGCRWQPGPAKPAAVQPRTAGRWTPMKTTHVRVRVEELGTIPNSGLQLPAVSPDGQWVAYLKITGNQPVDADAPFAGAGAAAAKGLEAVSLVLRQVRPQGTTRVVCPAGACWPVWSADGNRLGFVVHDRSGRSELGLHDLQTGRTRRVAVGLNRMIMPSLSPSGRRLAVVDVSTDPNQSRLFVCDLDSLKLTPGPRAGGTQRQLWPHWISSSELVYLDARDGTAALSRWRPGTREASALCEINVPPSIVDAFQTLAGIARPPGPEGRLFAYYDAARDCIFLVDLAAGRQHGLPPRTRASSWFGARHIVAATDDDLLLAAADSDQHKRLLRGRWLPLWASQKTSQVLLCTQGADPQTFQLLRVHLIFAK